MEHMIIGTSGHIDHGKTALIRALTGRETDCLKEEKKRGISIDLGFTYFDLPNGIRAGIIDVPGHEKFLPNMLSGVCGMDIVLLVIALDEGIMPQTREHMDILEELNIPSGIVVLTKEDCVDPDWAELMEEEILEELKGSRFEAWPSVRVSAIKGTGIEKLKEMLALCAEKTERNRQTKGAFRMPIDRIMSFKGIGTVIAGTVLEGSIGVGEELKIYPIEKYVKVRSIQLHGSDSTKAYAGQRAAMNVTGVEKAELKRGMAAASKDSLRLTNRLDVRIHMTETTERVLKNQTRLHLHIGSAELLCRMILLDQPELHSGQYAYAQLVLEEPLAVKKKDRFILRFYSPLETVAGGFVLDEKADRHKRFDKAVIDYLKQKEEDRDSEILLGAIQKQKEKPIEKKELSAAVRIEEQSMQEHLEELVQNKSCIMIPGKKKQYYWLHELEMELWEELRTYLESFHKEHPYAYGPAKAILKGNTLKRWDPDRFDAYLLWLEEEQRIKKEMDAISLYEQKIILDAKAVHIKNQLQKAFRKARYDFVSAKGLCPKEMKEEVFKEFLEYLAKIGELTKISDDFYTVPEISEQILVLVRKYFETEETISFASLRDLLNTSRRSAKPLMAFLDEQKVTAWCGKETERKKYQER